MIEHKAFEIDKETAIAIYTSIGEDIDHLENGDMITVSSSEPTLSRNASKLFIVKTMDSWFDKYFLISTGFNLFEIKEITDEAMRIDDNARRKKQRVIGARYYLY